MAIHEERNPAAAADPRLKRPAAPGYIISHSRDRFFEDSIVVGWLIGAHWTHWQTVDQIYRSLRNSIVIGAYDVAGATFERNKGKPALVGFARIVSDRSTNSMLTDLYVHAPHRRRGVGRLLMQAVIDHDAVRPTLCVMGCRPHLRQFYSEFGFVSVGGDIMIRDPSSRE